MIGTTLVVAAPLERRLKKRLEKAVARALSKPASGMPTLRHVITISSDELRRQAFDDEGIRIALTCVIEDVARAHHMNERSLLTGDPRWFALVHRVDEWLGADFKPDTVDAIDLEDPSHPSGCDGALTSRQSTRRTAVDGRRNQFARRALPIRREIP